MTLKNIPINFESNREYRFDGDVSVTLDEAVRLEEKYTELYIPQRRLGLTRRFI